MGRIVHELLLYLPFLQMKDVAIVASGHGNIATCDLERRYIVSGQSGDWLLSNSRALT